MSATYVELEDLKPKYANATTATMPTLADVTYALASANRQLASFLAANSRSDSYGGVKEVGIELTNNILHTLQYEEGVEGFEYAKPINLTDEMRRTLMSETLDEYESVEASIYGNDF